MTLLRTLSVPDILRETPCLCPKTIVVLIISIPLLLLFIDYVDLLLGVWRVRSLHRASSQIFLNSRFRHALKDGELEKTLRNAYYACTKKGKAFAAKGSLDVWTVILPWESSKEWLNLSGDKLSFLHLCDDVDKFGYHTPITCKTHVSAIHACNNKKNLSKLQDHIVREMDEFLLGQQRSTEWNQFNPADLTHSLLVYLATSYVLGPELARDPEFVQRVGTHAIGVEQMTSIFPPWPRILWPLVWKLSPARRAWSSNISAMKEKLVPEIKRRINALQSGKEANAESTLLTILLKQAFKDGLLPHEKHGEEEKIHSLVMMAMFQVYEVWGPISMISNAMLLQVMANPEYIDALREEISDSLNASRDRWYCSDLITRTPKLESFTRESMRLYTPLWATLYRRVMKPLKLKSLNMTLSTGTYIAVPTRFIHSDPDNYPDPTTFNGYRFYDPVSKSNAGQSATSASDIYLSFGKGNGICPGRFIAVKILQIIFAKYILNYDMKFASKDQKVPPMHLFEGGLLMNPDVKALIRRRQSSLET